MTLSPEQRACIEDILANARLVPGALALPKQTVRWMCERLLEADAEHPTPYLRPVQRVRAGHE